MLNTKKLQLPGMKRVARKTGAALYGIDSPLPPGYVSQANFARLFGLPTGTLSQMLDRGRYASQRVTDGHGKFRRAIPVREVFRRCAEAQWPPEYLEPVTAKRIKLFDYPDCKLLKDYLEASLRRELLSDKRGRRNIKNPFEESHGPQA